MAKKEVVVLSDAELTRAQWTPEQLGQRNESPVDEVKDFSEQGYEYVSETENG